MGERTARTFVGFGFGAIQSGLFLFEAYRSGNFSRYVVAEVEEGLVRAVRENGGAYVVNVARKDCIEQVRVEGVEVYNPRVKGDREKIVEAIGEADEMATALPSVKFYDMGGQTSVAGMLGEGLGTRQGKRGVVYAAENHNHAAEILAERIQGSVGSVGVSGCRGVGVGEGEVRVQVLNTVIGKMSGVIGDAATMERMGLAAMAPGSGRAVLVEEFNRILISRIVLEEFERGIAVFVEKEDLLPFEEAKLYGHNAIHALIGYLADLRGLTTMAEAGKSGEIMRVARKAFIEESGRALIRKHGGLGDELFTEAGYRAYAEDLLDRMTRVNLNDLVDRVIRDPVRKLGWEDRLFGTMRMAMRYGIEPREMAKGAGAGVVSMIRHAESAKGFVPPLPPLPQSAAPLTEEKLMEILVGIWGGKHDEYADEMVRLTWEAMKGLVG
ncbi:MAG: hypothetical protein NTU53_10515 [Planctomycetota bacterium]|nr:hypothetical protein [Planctomycetota bacterium]